MTDQNKTYLDDFECVEPDLGARLWRWRDPKLDAELKTRLSNHLSVCDACRLTLLVENRITGALQAGDLHLATPAIDDRKTILSGPGRRRATNLAAAGAGLAIAASLALVFILPPTSLVPAGLKRSGGVGVGFIRPVEGEILAVSSPRLRWNPVPGASAYLIDVSQVDGPWSWSGRTREAAVTLTEDASLPRRGTFRALVEPIPADLAGLVGVSVYFERSGPRDFLNYRVAAARRWVQLLGGSGLVLLCWVTISRLFLRRRRPAPTHPG